MIKKRVLITGAGGAAAIALHGALRDQDNLEIYMADMNAMSSGLFLVEPKNRFLIPAGDAQGYALEILWLCNQLNIDILIPTVDCELIPIARYSNDFESFGIRVISSSLTAFQRCIDKYTLFQYLSPYIDVANFQLYPHKKRGNDLSYPYVVKPRVGSGSREVRLICKASDLHDIPTDGSFLIQAYLPGQEYSVDVYMGPNGFALASVIRERIKIDSGVAVISRTVHNPVISALSERIASIVGLRYAVNLQFKLDAQGNPRLLEINPRFPGTMPLTIKAGVNMPLMCVDECRNSTLQDHYSYQEIGMVRTWMETFIPSFELTPKTVSQ